MMECEGRRSELFLFSFQSYLEHSVGWKWGEFWVELLRKAKKSCVFVCVFEKGLIQFKLTLD